VMFVVKQRTHLGEDNLWFFRPDIVTNADDWRTGPQSHIRQQTIDIISEWGGKLVEFPYTEGISSSLLNEERRELEELRRLRN